MLVFKQEEAKVRCECGEEISVKTQDFEPDPESYETSSNSMGAHQVYTLRYEATCQKCGNQGLISVSAEEYPEGVCNYSYASVSEGFELVGEEPCLEVDQTPPDYER